MTLRQKRAITLAGIFVAGGYFIWIGLDGFVVSSVPAQYLGCIVLGIGVAGLCGVNIWSGGPLDPRHDSNSDETDAQ